MRKNYKQCSKGANRNKQVRLSSWLVSLEPLKAGSACERKYAKYSKVVKRLLQFAKFCIDKVVRVLHEICLDIASSPLKCFQWIAMPEGSDMYPLHMTSSYGQVRMGTPTWRLFCV